MSRERDLAVGIAVLRLVARGWSAKQIGAVLDISAITVDRRLRQLYGILGARTAAHAVAIAGMERLLSGDDLRAAAADRRIGWKPLEEGEPA